MTRSRAPPRACYSNRLIFNTRVLSTKNESNDNYTNIINIKLFNTITDKIEFEMFTSYDGWTNSKKMDAGSSCTLSHEANVFGIAAKKCNVLLDPSLKSNSFSTIGLIFLFSNIISKNWTQVKQCIIFYFNQSIKPDRFLKISVIAVYMYIMYPSISIYAYIHVRTKLLQTMMHMSRYQARIVYVSSKGLALDTRKFKSIRDCLDSIMLSSGYASRNASFFLFSRERAFTVALPFFSENVSATLALKFLKAFKIDDSFVDSMKTLWKGAEWKNPYRSVTNVDVQSIRRRQTGLRTESLRSEGVRVEAGLDADEA
ncbi:hypothetical protein V1478_006447 [Vespula squamosa]|uniref:Uncharacterized protein n=1 Tax=Vespula squamosa TaxID=30214 RepID=A0ABD2B7X4_VESSQ